jgi:simple sugar transport system permease protein
MREAAAAIGTGMAGRILDRGFGLVFPLAVALAVSALVLLSIGENPLEIFRLMAVEAFAGERRIAATLSAATPLLFTGVATAICFRSGVFNVGVDGAFVLGGLAAAFVGFSLPGSLGIALPVLALAFAMVVGGVWLFVPGVLLARLEVDEVVSTLMLNFVAAGIAGYLVNGPLLSPASGNNMTPLVEPAAQLARLLPPSTLHAGFIIAMIVLIGYAIWTRRTAIGFEAELTGLNRRFVRAMGISIPAVIVTVMTISGLIAGLGGGAHALGQIHRFTEGFSPGFGFTGMAVALLGRNTATGIFFGAVLFGALASAGTTVQLFSNIPLDLVNIIEGTVMIFAVVEIARLRFFSRGGPA